MGTFTVLNWGRLPQRGFFSSSINLGFINVGNQNVALYQKIKSKQKHDG